MNRIQSALRSAGVLLESNDDNSRCNYQCRSPYPVGEIARFLWNETLVFRIMETYVMAHIEIHMAIFLTWLFSLIWEIVGILLWFDPLPHFVLTTVIWGSVILTLAGSGKLFQIPTMIEHRLGIIFIHLMPIAVVSTLVELVINASGLTPDIFHPPLSITLGCVIGILSYRYQRSRETQRLKDNTAGSVHL